MILNCFFILLGLVLLFFGAEILVRGATSLSLRLGISPLVIGLTVLAFSTSSPELVVGLKAAWQGNGGIALGNVLGSNIANTGLILGIAALITPLIVNRQLIRKEILVMIGMTLLFPLFMMNDIIARWEGLILFGVLIIYVVYSVVSAKRTGEELSEEELEDMGKPKDKHWSFDLALIMVGLAMLTAGAHFMVKGAVYVASSMGVSQAFIGLTIVAIGTSLPELATSVVAALKKQTDLMVGNIIGSNIFNIGTILGISSMAYPLHNQGITQTDLLILVAFSLTLLPIMKSGYRVCRTEGALLLLAYFGYMASLVIQIN